MSNTDKIQPTGKVIPNVQRVGMRFGKPMYFDGDSTDLQYLRDVTDQIMNSIHALSEQEYVDIYAPKKSKRSQIQEEED
jgi:1-acyl-sn-glycerol-3-phosphate acyltransferase